MDLEITHQCPQCGAPATLHETDRLFSCAYCRVRSYLLVPAFFRYVLTKAGAEDVSRNDRTVFFVPYWRLKGMQFSNSLEGVIPRHIDRSYLCDASAKLPPSLGLRSQALSLRFAAGFRGTRYILPRDKYRKALHRLAGQRASTRDKDVFHRDFIGERLSLIYAPYYIKDNRPDRIYDAITDSAVASDNLGAGDLLNQPLEKPHWPIRFVAAMCPGCGWDLDGQRDAEVLVCQNCRSIWQSGKQGLKPLRCGYLAGAGTDELYMPFWRIKAQVSGVRLDSYADLIRTANLPQTVKAGDEEMAFRFWCPAFKIRPQTLLRLARNLTLTRPPQKVVRDLPQAEIHPANLSLREAVPSLKINLGSFLKPRQKLMPLLPHIGIKPQRYLLVYVPFTRGHHDLTCDFARLTINNNQLRLSHNL